MQQHLLHHIQITQADLDVRSVTNSATATGSTPKGGSVSDTSDDPNNSTNVDNNNDGDPDDDTVTTFQVEGSIGVTKATIAATDGAYDTVGEMIRYNIVVTNTGSTTLTNVNITDANADAGSISPATIATLTPGNSVTVFATHAITQADIDAGSVNNTANVSATDPFNNTVADTSDDPNNTTDNDTNGDGEPDDVTETTVDQNSGIELTKIANVAADGLYDSVGEVITYTIIATNTGNVTLTDVIVIDANADAGSISPVSVATLAPGKTTTFTASHVITQSDLNLSDSVSNTAMVEAKDPKGGDVKDEKSDDPTTPALNDATVISVQQNSKLEIIKTVDNSNFSTIGEVLTYTITATNTGNVTLLNVVLNDNNAMFTGASTMASLNPGEMFSATATHVVTSTDIKSGIIF